MICRYSTWALNHGFKSQVGNHESSGASWSRPEEINQNGRTIHKINSGKRGQDVAADTAAALAATAILLKASGES